MVDCFNCGHDINWHYHDPKYRGWKDPQYWVPCEKENKAAEDICGCPKLDFDSYSATSEEGRQLADADNQPCIICGTSWVQHTNKDHIFDAASTASEEGPLRLQQSKESYRMARSRYKICPACSRYDFTNNDWNIANWIATCIRCGYFEDVVRKPSNQSLACKESGCLATPKCTTECSLKQAIELKAGDKVYNDQGGSQSYVPYRFDLILSDWLLEVAQVLHEGAIRHGENNWQKIPLEDHLNHAMIHIQQYRQGDLSERHLINVVCRMMFAYWCDKQDQPTDDVDNPISMEY